LGGTSMEARGSRRIFLWCFERGWLCSYVKVDREPEAFMARAPSGKTGGSLDPIRLVF
jgi:hypothetical protein